MATELLTPAKDEMSRDIFVVAGDHGQFMRLCAIAEEHWRYELTHRMVHYVFEPADLIFKKPARVILYGTFDRRADWPAIRDEIARYKHRAMKIR